MSFSICVIDDGLGEPAKKKGLVLEKSFDKGITKKFTQLDEKFWGEEYALKELCTEIVSDEYDWSFRGFANPQFFLQIFKKEHYRPNLIVFDWEYRNMHSGFNAAEYLLNLLSLCHSYIYVFTGQDNIEEIETRVSNITDKAIPDFKSRVQVLDKNQIDGSNHLELLDKIKQLTKDKFTFKFGDQLRETLNKSLDSVLVKLVDLNLSQAIQIFEGRVDTEFRTDFKQFLKAKYKEAASKDNDLKTFLATENISENATDRLFELIGEKVGNDIETSALSSDGYSPAPASSAIEDDIWSYRLYHNSLDSNVRRGDIFLDLEQSCYHLVINDPCSLTRFWKSNAGRLNTVKMLILSHDDDKALILKSSERVKKRGDLKKN